MTSTNRTKRLLLPALVALMWLCFTAAHCTVTLTVNDLPDPALIEIGDRVEDAVNQRFLALHPNVRLKRGSGLKIEGGSNTADMVPMMQIAGDISPDILSVYFRFSGTYVESGFLRPLDDFVATIDEKELARRIPPAVRDVCYREGPDGKKHWYFFPKSKMIQALVYRRDLFARAGLDPDKPPRTWSELEAYAKKLSDPANGHMGMGFLKGDISGAGLSNLVLTRGGTIVVKNKRGEWEPSFNTPEVVDALYFYVRMNCLKWKGPDGKTYRGFSMRDSPISMSASGFPYAMAFDHLWELVNAYPTEIIRYVPMPYPDGVSNSFSQINGQIMGVYSGVIDPATARAAFDYINFIGSDEANSIRVKMYIQFGYGKMINPELLDRFGYKDYLKQVDKRWLKVYKNALVNGKPEPYGKNCSIIYRELSRPVEQAINDRQVLNALDRGDEQAVKKRLKVILDHAQTETMKKMFGTLPPEVKRIRNGITAAFLALTALAFGLATFFLIRDFRLNAPAPSPGSKKGTLAYLLLLPAVASVIIWQYYPLARGTVMAFQDYSIVKASPFIGIANFSTILFDAGFWHSVLITLLYTLLYMTFAFTSPICVALLLSEVPRAKMLFRTMFYLPAVLSGLVVIFLWKSFYKPTGLLNLMLSHFGINIAGGWLDSPTLAMASVLLPIVWAGMGPGALIYLAAFKTIPDEFYEAAEVDGAGIIRKIFSITLPSIKMLILINAVGAFIGAFMSSEMIFAMTGGGPYTPYGATEVVGLQLFYTAFVYLKFGMANAMAWVLGFMLLGFTLIQLKSLSRVEFKGGR